MFQIIRPVLEGGRTGTTVTRVLGKTLPSIGRCYGTSIVLHNFCKLQSANDIKLGMLTLNPKNPLSEYHQVLNKNHRLQKSRTVGTSFSSTLMEARKKSSFGNLVQFIAPNISFNKKREFQISADGWENVELANPNDKFKEAVAKSTVTQDWITNNVIKPGNSAYFIVGYSKVRNPKAQSSMEVDGGGSIKANPSKLVRQGMPLAAPVIGAIKQIGETTVEGKWDNSSLQQYGVNGDAIYAIKYRKIKLSWFRRPNIDQLELNEGRWEVLWPTRSTDGHEDKTFVEVELDQDGGIDPDDMELLDDHEEVAWERSVRLVESDGNVVEEELWVPVDPDMGKRSGTETVRR